MNPKDCLCLFLLQAPVKNAWEGWEGSFASPIFCNTTKAPKVENDPLKMSRLVHVIDESR